MPATENTLNRKQLLANFVSGGMSGATTGAIVAVPEYTKVLFQSNRALTWRGFVKPEVMRTELPNMLRTIPSFSGIFGLTCAIEFSVNSYIGKEYGQNAGLAASAVSGATFLTAADHLMLRRHKGQGAVEVLKSFSKTPTRLFTGWTPMAAREACFIASVVVLGPGVGASLKGKYGSDNPTVRENYFWNFVGRLTTGFVTTLASQPFDSLARQMQIKYYENPARPVNVPELLRTMKLDKLFYRGAGPRLFLATVGGALAGNLYEFYSEMNKKWHPSLFSTQPALQRQKMAVANDAVQDNNMKNDAPGNRK